MGYWLLMHIEQLVAIGHFTTHFTSYAEFGLNSPTDIQLLIDMSNVKLASEVEMLCNQ